MGDLKHFADYLIITYVELTLIKRKNEITNNLEKVGNKIDLTPEQANKLLQEELIPNLKEKIIKAKNSGMSSTEYFNFSNK